MLRGFPISKSKRMFNSHHFQRMKQSHYTLPRNEILCHLFRGIVNNKFHIKWRFGTLGSWKNQNPGGHFGATSLTALPIQPILPDFLVYGPNYQCCLAGSSQTAPRILVFSNQVVSPSLFENVKEKWVPEITHHCQRTPFLFVSTTIFLGWAFSAHTA